MENLTLGQWLLFSHFFSTPLTSQPDNHPVRSALCRKQLWIGLAEVVPRSGHPLASESSAAFTNVLGHGADPREFRCRAVRVLNKFGLDLYRLEDVEVFASRIRKHYVSLEVRKLADEAEATGNIVFGTFHTFPLTDLESADPSEQLNSLWELPSDRSRLRRLR